MNIGKGEMIKIKRSKSGFTLVTEQIEGVRSISVGIWCDTGSVNEKVSEEGASHYIEHMLFKGTKSRSAFMIADEIERIGGQQNAFTGKEATCFFVRTLDEHFEAAADVLTDMICNPLFDPDEMEREKLVVCEEINMNADDPDDVALDNLERIINRGTRMAHPVLGSRKNVNNFSQEMIIDYYKRHYTGDNIVVSIAGSFDEESVSTYFEKALASLPANGEKQIVEQMPASSSVSGYYEVKKNIEQAHIAMGVRGLPANDDSYYKLLILNTLLGGGMSSRLFQHIREKRGLAYSINSMVGAYKRNGILAITAGISKDRVEEALEAIRFELKILHDKAIRQSEVVSAREQLKSSCIFSRESVQSRMIANGRSFLLSGKVRSQDEILNIIDAITLEDIEDIKSIIDDYDKYTIVNVCPKGEYN